jgi:uncharacterized membrane protein
MKLSNPLEMNDWRIRGFLLFSFSALGLLWITFALDSNGLHIPLLQQGAGCVCLLFIPGIAILRILHLHKLGSVEAPLYAVGISISVVIFSGFALNEFAPRFGIPDPLSALHLILFMSGLIVALCIASYWRDKDFASPTQLNKDILSPGRLSLLLLPFLSIFGAYLVNNYEINWLILLMLLCIGIVVLATCSRRNIDGSLYPLALFVISLSLLLSNTLISRYLWGWDIFWEARFVDSVVSSAVWNPLYAAFYGASSATAVARYNSVLSLSILAPALSQIGNFDTTSLFKIVYPAIFSLVPVALYQLYRKQTSDIVAFLASFAVISTLTFVVEMPSIARQEIAELFLALILLLIFNNTFRTQTKTFMLILFSGTMIVSHYGISWLFMIQLIAVFILLFLADSNFSRRVAKRLVGSIPALEATTEGGSSTYSIREHSTLAATFVILFAAIACAWYAYTENALLFSDFFQRSAGIVNSDWVASGVQMAQQVGSHTLLGVLATRLNTVAMLLIALGVIAVFVQRKRMGFDKTYLAFTVTACGLAILVVGVPALYVIWNSSRLQHLYMFFLAPFLILGVMMVFRLSHLIIKKYGGSRDLESKAYPVAAVFLVILLLFNTGFVFALAHEPIMSPSLFHEEIPMFVHPNDLAGAKWLGAATRGDYVYGDYFSLAILAAYSNIPIEKLQALSYDTDPHTAYPIYVCSSQATSSEFYSNPDNLALLGRPVIESPAFTANLSRIYDSGCVIYGAPAK